MIKILLLLLLIPNIAFATFGQGEFGDISSSGSGTGGGTECSTSSCNLNSSTTLGSQTICLADGTGCGTTTVAKGGTALTSWADDTIGIGAGGSLYQQKTLPSCPDTSGNHLNYDASTNSLSCGTSSSGGVVGSNAQVIYNSGGSSFAGNASMTVDTTINAASGTETPLRLTPTVSQSSTAGYDAFQVDVTESSTGSGSKNLINLKVGGSSKFNVDNAGATTAVSYTTTSTSAGSIQLNEASANGANYFKVKAKDSVTQDTTVTLDGTNGTTITFPATTDTLRGVTPRIDSVASSATPSINVDTTDQFNITALATAITSMTTGLSGTPRNGQKLVIRILDNGTARGITWGASFDAKGGVALPTTTVLSKYLYVGFIYNSTTSTWNCVFVGQE